MDSRSIRRLETFLALRRQPRPRFRISLVRLDPTNGNVRLVGDLGVSGSDIGFDSHGTLFIWLPATSQLGKVDLKTGAVTKIGRARGAMAVKGGFAVNAAGGAFVAGSGAKGTLDTVDLQTGNVVASVPFTGARYPALINGLASSFGTSLLGVNTDGGTPSLADLVKIDIGTGSLTVIGPLPNDTDALAFAPTGGGNAWDLNRGRSLLFAVLVVLAIGALIFSRKWFRS